MKKILIALVAFTSLTLAGCGNHTVNLSNYIKITHSGGDGVGIARVEYDKTALKSELTSNYGGNPLDADYVADNILGSISYSLDNNRELSNGDVVTLTITWNDAIVTSNKFKFKGDSYSVKINELTKRETLDLFEGVEVLLDGVGSNAVVSVVNNSSNEVLSNVQYNVDKYKAGNGDEVTVTAWYNSSVISNDLYIIDETQKTFVASGAGEYTTDFDDVSDELLTKIKSQAYDVLTAYLANSSSYMSAMHQTSSTWGLDESTINISKKELVYGYFSSYKDGLTPSYNEANNGINLVYEVVSTDNKSEEPITSFVTIFCKDLITGTDGNTTIDMANITVSKSYKTKDSLVSAVVDANRAKYEIEEITVN